MKAVTAAISACILFQSAIAMHATSLRRALSPQTPMFLFQVQQTDPADPQAAIDAVPADVRNYTVMMYCLGAQSGTQTNGYALADYFCNVCQQNGVWCMVQVASGYANTMNNTNTTDYAALFQKYPNLIGFAFAEQDWGFVANSSQWGPSSFPDRLALFADLLSICNQYGGYLYVSEMQSISNPGYNPISKFKTSPDFANATKIYKNNYIVGDKFTSSRGYYDNESVSLGVYLSGHAGNYAVRFDEYAWPYSGRSQLYGLKNSSETNLSLLALFSCPEPAQGIPIVDHLMLQGATVIDGPEVPGYSTINNGRLMPCYQNMTSDIFRKVLDGTIKIPSLTNVLSHTPLAYVCNQNNNLTGDVYNGLYMIDGDGTNNHDWFKSGGRYASIPGIFTNSSYETSFFKTNVLESEYSSRWPTIASKTNELNNYFPSEYSGTAFVARRDNQWFTYNNSLNSNVTETASIPLKYNTCTNLTLTYPPQTFAVIVESNKNLQIYFNNYFTDKDALWTAANNNVNAYIQTNFITNPPDSTTNTTRTTIFKISGCTNSPTYTLTNRGSHKPMTNSATFANGVFTLTLTGNGPCDININCSGSAARTNAVPLANVMVPPADFAPELPAPPGLVTATAGNGQATISWHATNCLYYNIKRGLSLNGPFTNIATGITNSVNLYSSFGSGATVYNTFYSYVDAGLQTSNTYFYVVSAVNVSGEGENSDVASATLAPALSINPVADAYVRDGGSANSNFGNAADLWVKADSSGFNRITFLKFNVAGLTNALNATLVLIPSTTDAVIPTLTYQWETNDNWTETGITWNNRPTDIPSVTFTNQAGYAVGTRVSIDVTSIAKNQATNDGFLSIRISSLVTNSQADVAFCSKECTTISLRPVITYPLPSSVPPVINSFTVVSNHPQISISGIPNASYTVLTSTNLIDWESIFTTNPALFPFTFTDIHSPTNFARFYRVQIN
ncbi:MAG TPA: glycoside hydrolase family 98 domain-containing protein [Verrucomicrobiae bacterium]|nr:glycoside hydrolase family 98 domain-containing protein [Verrucomicrobiae bacterium]